MSRFSVWLLLLFLLSCDKAAQIQAPPKPQVEVSAVPSSPKPKPHPQLDSCALLSKEEVGAIQSATILQSQGSETSDGTYLISQCYYASRETNMSVSFSLIEPNPQNSAGAHPREYWERIFGEKEGEEKREGKRSEREEEEKAPPRKIEGVGEEAFWTGNRFGGALYVLKDDLVLRVSVGGPDKEEGKINKSKALAEKAITNLRNH